MKSCATGLSVRSFASSKRVHPAKPIPQFIDFRRKLPKECRRRPRIIPIEQLPLQSPAYFFLLD